MPKFSQCFANIMTWTCRQKKKWDFLDICETISTPLELTYLVEQAQAQELLSFVSLAQPQNQHGQHI